MIYTRLVDDAVDGIVVVVPRESLSINGVDGVFSELWVFVRCMFVRALFTVHHLRGAHAYKTASKVNPRSVRMSVF